MDDPAIFNQVVLVRQFHHAWRRAFAEDLFALRAADLGLKPEDPPLIDIFLDQMTRTYVLQLHQYITGAQLDTQRVEHPATWWDAFKERWFPEWARRRWPSNSIVHVFDVRVLYPTVPHPTLNGEPGYIHASLEHYQSRLHLL